MGFVLRRSDAITVAKGGNKQAQGRKNISRRARAQAGEKAKRHKYPERRSQVYMESFVRVRNDRIKRKSR